MKNILVGAFPEERVFFFFFFLRAAVEMALRNNALNFRSTKGQSHHFAGTRNISLERKNYNSTQTTWYAHDVVAH